MLAEKGKVARSGVSVFCHTTAAPVPPGQHEEWLKEEVERSTYLADQSLVEVFLKEIGDRLKEMISFGVEFERKPDGGLRTEAIRGQKRTASALYFGRQMMEKMREEALRRGVEFEERVMIIDLLTSDGCLPTRGRITGAVGLETRTGNLKIFKAGSVVLATGPMSTKGKVLYANGLSGDGHAMAFRTGAELMNMEMASGQSFGIWNRKFATGGQQQFLMNNSRIVNRLGERIMERYMASAKVNNPEFDSHVEFGDICRAIAIENLEGRGPCYFDLRGWSQENVEKIRKVLPTTMAAFADFGIDVRKDLIESTPMTTTYCGSHRSGLRITPDFETTISGLYATGVTAFVGGGISPQGFSNVSGYRAGESAARKALKVETGPISKKQIETLQEKALSWQKGKKTKNPDYLYSKLNKTLVPYGSSFFKNEKRIKAVLTELERMEKEELPRAFARDAHDLVKLFEFYNTITVLKIIYACALERKESRFGHYREEFPYRDDLNWLKWTAAKNDGIGGIDIRLESVPYDNYPVKPGKLSKVPSNTRYILKQ